jgi:hypothetical protein
MLYRYYCVGVLPWVGSELRAESSGELTPTFSDTQEPRTDNWQLTPAAEEERRKEGWVSEWKNKSKVFPRKREGGKTSRIPTPHPTLHFPRPRLGSAAAAGCCWLLLLMLMWGVGSGEWGVGVEVCVRACGRPRTHTHFCDTHHKILHTCMCINMSMLGQRVHRWQCEVWLYIWNNDMEMEGRGSG